MGPCPLIHDDRLKVEFDQLSEHDKKQYGYHDQFYRRIKDLTRALEDRTKKNQERLEMKGDDEVERAQLATREDRNEKIVMVEEKIKAIQARIEQCGEDGLIDEARELDRDMETLNIQLQSLRAEEQRERSMELCMVCGSLLVANDVPERRQAHLDGKQHLGYKRLRETFETLSAQYDAPREAPKYDMAPPPARHDDRAPHHDDRHGSSYNDRHRQPPPRDESRGGDYNRGYDDRRRGSGSGDDRRGGDRRGYHESRRRSRSPPRRRY